MAMVEPLPYHREADGSLRLLKDAPSLARAVAIASGLGTTSAYTWLKMPSCDDPEAVFAATTLPCVVLGGVPDPDPAEDLASWGRALDPARRPRPGRRAGAALPAGRRRARRGATPRPQVLRRRRGAAVSLLRTAHDRGGPGVRRRDHARGRRLGLDRAAGAAARRRRRRDRRDRRVGAVRAAARPGRLRVDGRRRDASTLAGPRLGVHPGDRLRLRRPRHASPTLLSSRTVPRSRCRRRGASARCRRRTAPRQDVPVEVRGAGTATRQVTNFGVPGVWDHAEKLVCCELLTPPGNWSSYPPHKHDASEPVPGGQRGDLLLPDRRRTR